jgi:hypothetical protein
MHLPDPRLRRVATLVAIDPDQRVALFLLVGSTQPHWVLPKSTVQLMESYSEAVVRLSARCLGSRALRWGSVVAHRWASPPSGAPLTRTEEHIFIARAGPSPPRSPSHADATDSDAAWMPRASLGRLLQETHLDSTASLVDGYLDGWLPDGPITLG